MRKVRLALAQFNSILGDVEANIRKAEGLVKQAAAEGADLICFPEMFTTGYNLSIIGGRLSELALSLDSPEVKRLKDTGAQCGIWVIAPFVERRRECAKLFNSAAVISNTGEILGSYAKTHLWDLEKEYFEPGPDYLVFDAPFARFGVIICYDAGFPEACRSLNLKGAELVFLPSAWRIQDKDIWDLNIPQRALENILFVAAVNRFGYEDGLFLFGNSKVANPRGTIIFESPLGEESLDIVEIDLDQVARFREEIPYLKDRCPEKYVR